MSQDPVRVAVRFRPLNDREHKIDKEQRPEALSKGFIIGNKTTVVAYYDLEKLYFQFDHIFTDEARQEDVYNYAVAPAVDDVLMGYNGTILAYGQTGAGKSYTMQGPPKRLRDPVLQGAIPRVCGQIFGEARNREEEGATVTIKCSFLQIYQEGLYDMMKTENNLKLRETPGQGVWVDNLTQAVVKSEAELMRYVVAADKSRSVAHTDMSERSSRSHSLVTLVVEQSFEDGMVITGKLVMVDLAGSEKVHKSRASGGALVEARGINKSLSALGNCIQALTEPSRGHVPYRDSKLTHLLKDSLGGNTKTSLLVACSPHWSNYEETVSSLRFATRAKELKIVAKVNQSSVAETYEGKEEETVGEGLTALQTSLSSLFVKFAQLQPGGRLGAHHMNEIQHMGTWCQERMTHLIQKGQSEEATAAEVNQGLRDRTKKAEQQVATDAKHHAAMMHAQRDSEQRSEDTAAQVVQLEEECHRLREQVHKLTEQNERQMQMIGAGSSRATNVDHSKEVQRWKAKYEALKSRLPQMFDLVMENDECESPTRDHVAAAPHHSPAKVAAHSVQSPADLEFGLVELQLKYEESRSNLSMANAVLAQRDVGSPVSWHQMGDASLSLSPSLSQSVSQSPMKSPLKSSPLKTRTNVSNVTNANLQRGRAVLPEKALRNAISNTSFMK